MDVSEPVLSERGNPGKSDLPLDSRKGTRLIFLGRRAMSGNAIGLGYVGGSPEESYLFLLRAQCPWNRFARR